MRKGLYKIGNLSKVGRVGESQTVQPQEKQMHREKSKAAAKPELV